MVRQQLGSLDPGMGPMGDQTIVAMNTAISERDHCEVLNDIQNMQNNMKNDMQNMQNDVNEKMKNMQSIIAYAN